MATEKHYITAINTRACLLIAHQFVLCELTDNTVLEARTYPQKAFLNGREQPTLDVSWIVFPRFVSTGKDVNEITVFNRHAV